MESQSLSCASLRHTDNGQSLTGEIAHVYRGGRIDHKGLVDAVMPGSSGLWIVLDGVAQRDFLDAASEFEILTSPYRPSRIS
jgi:hypothetical protein